MTRIVAERQALLAGIPVRERELAPAGIPTTVLEGGEGSPIVLLHGPGGNAAHWFGVLPALTGRHRVVAPDLPGQGESSTGDAELDQARVLRWLAELIEQTCAEAPVLVGNALGGAIAARFAAAHGDRVAQLVLVDALGLVPFAPEPGFGAALHAYLAEPGDATHDELWAQCAHDLDTLRERMPWAPFAAYNVERARTPAVQAALAALMEHFGLPAIPDAELARISVPTTLIWGRHDRATPLAVAEAARDRFGWPLNVIDGAADDPPIERPDALARALATALAAPDRVAALRRRLGSAVLEPHDAGFAEATDIWNGLAVRRPALVVQPSGAEDVADALEHARACGLPVAVRGRGHNIAGAALAGGGLTLDMARLRSVQVDAAARTATVGAGCALGDVDRATQRHGLATPLGFFSVVGVAGLTLGGGLGYLSRRFGWTVDNLLAVELVTADGSVHHASRDADAELFWGVRGAGAHLGVVTSLTYGLHPVGPEVYGGLIAWPFTRAREVLRAYRELTEDAPRELTVFLLMLRAPAAPFVPAAIQGERVCAMAVCHSGAAADREAALAPLRALGAPAFDLLHAQPYTELQSYLDATEPRGHQAFWRTEYVAELREELLDTLADLFATCPIPQAQVGVLHLGGAIGDRAGDDGAVGNRDAGWIAAANGFWEPGEDIDAAWVRGAWERFRPFGTGSTYVNFQTADEGGERRAASYGGNLERLRALKRRVDPEGMFRPLG